ncbi:hypothetical protein K4F52_007550 [Lecanicillium sp. MT-2017a]|nr:hypothetical protein K4F52_007550 [Lecanicillium sp. MT-2017a]
MALELQDVPAAAELFARSFDNDRHMQMKNLDQREPYDLKKYALEAMPDYVSSPRCVFIKAVDSETGELMGFCNWGFKGFAGHEMQEEEEEEEEEEVQRKQDKSEKEKEQQQEQPLEELQPASQDPIDRLQQYTSNDLNDWANEVMNEAPKCMHVVLLAVSPKFQDRGAGSGLLRWGTNAAERHGVVAWASSSEPAWPMYEKCRFEVVRSLDVDLDEYAPCTPPDEGPDAKWGHYVFRYMKYFPSRSQSDRYIT